MTSSTPPILSRWKLVLGRDADDQHAATMPGSYEKMDDVLAALYGGSAERPGSGQLGKGQPGAPAGTDEPDARRGPKTGLGSTVPRVSRWLGDIRTYFPTDVVAVMQQDAMTRLGLDRLLLEPEILRTVQPDVQLVGTLLSLSRVMPQQAKDTARQVVASVVREVERRLSNALRQAVTGALSRAVRNPRPRYREIDWGATIKANLKHYQPAYRSIIPERLVGLGRRGQALKEIVLCLDQSGSMATSVVYAGIFGAVLASLKAIKTHMVVYDTAVVDLTANLQDPVDLLFGVQLGGGNDTPLALRYCEQLITRPVDTILVLISDLYEGAGEDEMLKRAAALKAAGVTVAVLLALSDDGAPDFDRRAAGRMAALGIPCFACTPKRFPDLIAAAIQGRQLEVTAGVAIKGGRSTPRLS